MSDKFFKQPILNSPYECPSRHWHLDEDGLPTQQIIEQRRQAKFITPIPKPKRRRNNQREIVLGDEQGLSSEKQQYSHTRIINSVREEVRKWRALPESDWRVTPATARLLKHWRHHKFADIRPFFCQVEAAETAIWLTEVAPHIGKVGKQFLEHLESTSEEANPGLLRLALKLATGAGKTTVIAMLIAWQTVNAVRNPQSKRFTKGFLVVTPGITIKDRLRVLQPNDPHSYYQERELVPKDMLGDIRRATIIITNYHAFKLRETVTMSAGGRKLLQGDGPALNTAESRGQMMKRVMPELLRLKNILVFNDEAHHCYHEKPGDSDEDHITGEDRKEAEENRKAARLWISGLEIVKQKIGINRVIDLSATPFFLSGSGYVEGTLFPWTMCDFSLMDAIECGIVKLPRVPVMDNSVIPGKKMPMYRNLWEHIRRRMPKKGRAKSGALDSRDLPVELNTALDALYGHYEDQFERWKNTGISVPPCFIIVCNNTATSKLVFDYISGSRYGDKPNEYRAGALKLFRNFDDNGERLARPRTLLIDSRQLESGDALDDNFRKVAKAEIENFRRNRRKRTGDTNDKITDHELLREIMNTVGKEGELGASIRCVVSVSMLSEGWDANNVTHILGVRAFGTQLLCEQVVGRALRRQSYDLYEKSLLRPEYADVLGIPFDFTAKPVDPPLPPPVKRFHVKAISPKRDHLEIRFPNVAGYSVDLPHIQLSANFNADSTLVLDPELVGATHTRNSGIIGEMIDLDLEHTNARKNSIIYELTAYLMTTRHWRTKNGHSRQLFGQLRHITEAWLDNHLECKGGTTIGQLKYKRLADMASERINNAIVRAEHAKHKPIRAMLEPYNPEGSTRHVNFKTAKECYETDPRRCHLNYVVLDSEWEADLCFVIEKHPRVHAYVKNHNLGLRVPYRWQREVRDYYPDFIVLVNDGKGKDDLLRLVIEVKGYRREDAKVKKETMDVYWVPGVNRLGDYGRWAFAEFTDVHQFQESFAKFIELQIATIPTPTAAPVA